MHLNNISNFFFGISKFNILFSLIKKFIFVGKILVPSSYASTFVDVRKKRTLIYSNNKPIQKELVFNHIYNCKFRNLIE